MKTGHALALARKDWRRIFREPAFLFMLILFPVMLTVAFGTSFGAVGGSQATQFKIGVVALGGDTASSTRFSQGLVSSGAFSVSYYADNGTAQSSLSQGQLQALVLLPPCFDQSVQSYEANPGEPGDWTNSTISVYLDRGSALTAQVIPTILAQVLNQGVLGVKAQAEGSPLSLYYPSEVTVKGTSVFQSFAPGLFAFASIYMIMIVAQSYTTDRETGVLGRILVTPTTGADIVMGSVLSYLVIALVQALLVFTCVYALGYHPAAGAAGLVMGFLIVTMFALCNIGFGLITAAVSKSAGAATGISFAFLMPQLFLGTFVGSALSSTAQEAGRFLPAYYVTDALTSLWTRGAAVTSPAVMTDLAAVIVSSAVILIAGIMFFRRFGSR
ncbi:MAG TPA: ABC transporter permease [Nitrososphaerales archaeon]|nr:ABC transporter permease [Nitrososphaerales archaeon]